MHCPQFYRPRTWEWKSKYYFWKIGYLYLLLVENIVVFHIVFSDIICFVNSRIWWYEYCVFFLWILCLLHIILTSLRCISYILYIDYIYCIICTKKCCMEYLCNFVLHIWIYSDILYIAYSDIMYCIFLYSDLLYCN